LIAEKHNLMIAVLEKKCYLWFLYLSTTMIPHTSLQPSKIAMRTLLAIALFVFAAAPLLAQETKQPFNILILTGGHDYDQSNFYKMFDTMPNVKYDKAEVPKEMDLLAPGLEKKYDLLLTYDMNNFPAITNAQRERYVALIESGMPLIVIHHSLCGYDNWMTYRKMIGGQYLHKAIEIDGKPYPVSSYKHDLDMAIQVTDKEHPITRGIGNFTIHDEGYKGMYIREGIHVLLKTDHPDATPEVAWTTKHGKAAIFVIALGHDKAAYENPNLRRILQQAIQWCVEETRK
jgi:type 1 glutamine amidotransferase